MIEVTCHCPKLRDHWQQLFLVLPREGETICRMMPDLDSDRMIMLMPRLCVVDVDHHVHLGAGRIVPSIHLYLMVIDEDEDDEDEDEEGTELVDLPVPGKRELVPA